MLLRVLPVSSLQWMICTEYFAHTTRILACLSIQGAAAGSNQWCYRSDGLVSLMIGPALIPRGLGFSMFVQP